jgi:hypothetical protein
LSFHWSYMKWNSVSKALSALQPKSSLLCAPKLHKRGCINPAMML